jgi:hypothetical protein
MRSFLFIATAILLHGFALTAMPGLALTNAMTINRAEVNPVVASIDFVTADEQTTRKKKRKTSRQKDRRQ